MDYLDFEIEVTGGDQGSYSVKVRSPAGEATSTMRFPFDQPTLTNRLQALQIALLRSSMTRRRIASPESLTVQEFGQELWKALFSGDVLSRYEASLQEAKHDQSGIRIKFRCDEPELAALPWEYLFDPVRGDFVALSANTPLVRYIPLPESMPPIRVTPPIRILAVAVSPSDLDGLDVERERSRLNAAMEPIIAKGRVELTWMPGQTWQDFTDVMLEGPWHVLHFIGHGGFDEKRQEGIVAFARPDGRADYKRATSLGLVLGDHRPLRLAVLNACETGRSDVTDLFSSTSGTLVRKGTPAVVAMQYEITDEAAIALSRSFYNAVAKGVPVDAALSVARQGLATTFEDTLEWGTPVLYLQAADGVLFDISAAPAAAPPVKAPPPVVPVPQPTEDRTLGAETRATPAAGREQAPERASADTSPEAPTPIGLTSSNVRPWRRLVIAATGMVVVIGVATMTVFALGGFPGTSPSPGNSASPSGAASEAASAAPSDILPMKWTVLGGAPFNGQFGEPAVAAHLGRLWIAGGIQDSTPLTTVHVYDPTTNSWDTGPRLPRPLTRMALVSDGGDLYLIGGEVNSEPVASVYRLSEGEDAWETAPPLGGPRSGGAAAWDGQHIVFAGGRVDSQPVLSRTIWELQGGSWSRLQAQLSVAREWLAAATNGAGRIWFIGGSAPGNKVFDTVDRLDGSQLRAGPHIDPPRHGVGAIWTARFGFCALGGAVGRGPGGEKYHDNTVDCHSGQGDGSLPNLPSERFLPGAAVLGDYVYVVGGMGNYRSGEEILRLRLP